MPPTPNQKVRQPALPTQQVVSNDQSKRIYGSIHEESISNASSTHCWHRAPRALLVHSLGFYGPIWDNRGAQSISASGGAILRIIVSVTSLIITIASANGTNAESKQRNPHTTCGRINKHNAHEHRQPSTLESACSGERDCTTPLQLVALQNQAAQKPWAP